MIKRWRNVFLIAIFEGIIKEKRINQYKLMLQKFSEGC